ncbi:hypothetical protein FHL15_009776 [Xylaria flabelliformis]|uniref:Cyanovirin-N domain-containing protein n=1 Tax=Xylaria flabelliformis TaxID=2512241 RepID=A0A553HN10_9PEZI|nr:hypothetical protein FHL15_009776 [Xylaria flabelliformis]
MQFTLATFVVAALAASANATVYLGTRTGIDGSQNKVAWTNGTPDVCSGFTTVSSASENPCDRDFNVDGNNGPFKFVGCGGAGLTLFRNGQFNTNCQSKGKDINCPDGAKIKQEWQC